MRESPAVMRQIPGWGHIPGDHVSVPHTDHFGRSCGTVETLNANDGRPVARVAVHDVTHEPTGAHEVHDLKSLKREPALDGTRTVRTHE